MPLYRYQCDECSHSFSQLEPVNTSNKTRTCESCGSKRARRLPSRVGVLFKGSGFYKTNYPRPSAKKETTSDSSSSKG